MDEYLYTAKRSTYTKKLLQNLSVFKQRKHVGFA